MYNDQAKNGFKTFVATLAISLAVFGAAYYFLTDISGTADIEAENQTKKEDVVAYKTDTDNLFKTLNTTKVDTIPAVLSGADVVESTEATEATVPDTGSETMIGTILALGAFSAAVYFVIANPRKFALTGFEKELRD